MSSLTPTALMVVSTRAMLRLRGELPGRDALYWEHHFYPTSWIVERASTMAVQVCLEPSAGTADEFRKWLESLIADANKLETSRLTMGERPFLIASEQLALAIAGYSPMPRRRELERDATPLPRPSLLDNAAAAVTYGELALSLRPAGKEYDDAVSTDIRAGILKALSGGCDPQAEGPLGPLWPSRTLTFAPYMGHFLNVTKPQQEQGPDSKGREWKGLKNESIAPTVAAEARRAILHAIRLIELDSSILEDLMPDIETLMKRVEPDLLKRKAVAEILGVSPGRVNQLAEDGRLPGFDILGEKVYRRTDAEKEAERERSPGRPRKR